MGPLDLISQDDLLSKKVAVVPPSPTIALLVWVGLQTGALALAACRIPLWAKSPEAMEFLAVQILLITQIFGSAMLFPTLAVTRTTTVLAISSIWPFCFLAGFLSSGEIPTHFRGGMFASAWIMALWIGNSPLSTTRAQKWFHSAVCAWVAGGCILLFISNEYAISPVLSHRWKDVMATGPAVASIHFILVNGQHAGWDLAPLIMPIFLGGTLRGLEIAVFRLFPGASKTLL